VLKSGDAVDADDTAAARRRMGAHARVAPRAELLAARIRIDLELAAQASFRAVFVSDMGPQSEVPYLANCLSSDTRCGFSLRQGNALPQGLISGLRARSRSSPGFVGLRLTTHSQLRALAGARH